MFKFQLFFFIKKIIFYIQAKVPGARHVYLCLRGSLHGSCILFFTSKHNCAGGIGKFNVIEAMLIIGYILCVF